MNQKTFIAADTQGKLEQIEAFLSGMPAWYLATSIEDQPHVRPFSFVALDGQDLWLSTSKGKDVYIELQSNPRFELTAWQPGSDWLIVTGIAEFAEPPAAIREAGFRHMVGLGEEHESANDGRLCFFRIAEGVARVCDITGEETSFDLP